MTTGGHLDHDPREIPPCLAVPAWNESTSPIIQCTIPGVGQKDSQSGPEKKSLTQEYLQTHYPKESWTHEYTDGSVENAVQNGRAGVLIHYTGGKEDKISLATSLCSTNYKAEAEALKTAATHIEVSTHASPNVVLTDALSVLQALQSKTLNTMTCLLLLPRFVEAMQSPCNGFPHTALCLKTRLLTLWQRKAQQRSKWISPQATLRWRPSSRPSNTASGGMSIHGTTRLTPTIC